MSFAEYPEALPRNTVLNGFQVEDVLGRGGFGITYLALDQELRARVALKEFFPNDMAVRANGGVSVRARSAQHNEDYQHQLENFREEARILAGFNHPNIVGVRRLFDANNTSYYSMDFVQGETLSAAIQRHGRLPSTAVMLLVEKLLDGLRLVHDRKLVHRDIKPLNVLLASLSAPQSSDLPDVPERIRTEFGRPVLIDFGAARISSRNAARGGATGLVTGGYSPIEQYSERSMPDPRSDLYSLAALAYAALGGARPADAPERQTNPRALVPAAEQFRGAAPAAFLDALDHALEMRAEDRPANVAAWRKELFEGQGVQSWSKAARRTEPTPPEPRSERPSGGASTSARPKPDSRRPDSYRPAPEDDFVEPIGGKGGMAMVVGLLALGALGIGGWAAWPSLESMMAPNDTPQSFASTSRAKSFDVPVVVDEWEKVDLAQNGIRGGDYTISSNGPFRVRAGEEVFTVTSGAPLQLPSDGVFEIELRAIEAPLTVTLEPK